MMKCVIYATLSAAICSLSPPLRMSERDGDDRLTERNSAKCQNQQSAFPAGRPSPLRHHCRPSCLEPFSYFVTSPGKMPPLEHGTTSKWRRHAAKLSGKIVASLPIGSDSFQGRGFRSQQSHKSTLRRTMPCRAKHAKGARSCRLCIYMVGLTTRCSYPAMNKSC